MKDTIYKIKKGMDFLLSRIAAILLIIMTLLVLYQVFTRYVLNNPSDFTEEMVRYMLVWTGFIGAAYAFNRRQHMALIFLKEKLKGNAQKTLSIIIDLLILLFAVLILIGGGSAITMATMGSRSTLLNFPRGLVYIIGPISGAFIALGQIVNLWEDVTGNIIEFEEEGE